MFRHLRQNVPIFLFLRYHQMNTDGNILASDKEIQAGLKSFSQCCSRTWLTAVTDAAESKKSKSRGPQKSGSLKKRQILIFFDACNNFVQLSETEEGLRRAYKTGVSTSLNHIFLTTNDVLERFLRALRPRLQFFFSDIVPRSTSTGPKCSQPEVFK